MNDTNHETRFLKLATQLEETKGCLNFLMRRSSRIIGRHFDAMLKPTGLRSTQFNVLAVLAQTGPMSLTDLAGLLSMERSALARNLKPLQRQGLIIVSAGVDKRMRIAQLTKLGKENLQKALPFWSAAQARLLEDLGTDDITLLRTLLGRITNHLCGNAREKRIVQNARDKGHYHT